MPLAPLHNVLLEQNSNKKASSGIRSTMLKKMLYTSPASRSIPTQSHPSTYSTKVIHPSIREGVVGGTFLKTIFSQKILGLKTNEASINSTFLEKYSLVFFAAGG